MVSRNSIFTFPRFSILDAAVKYPDVIQYVEPVVKESVREKRAGMNN